MIKYNYNPIFFKFLLKKELNKNTINNIVHHSIKLNKQ